MNYFIADRRVRPLVHARPASGKVCSDYATIVGLPLLLVGLFFLVGCQGVSAGPSSQQMTSAQLGVTPTTLGIGSVVVGTSGTASGGLTASGGSVTLTAVSSNNTAFTVSGISLPVTLSAGQTLPFTVTFSPLVTGSASAKLTFTSNAPASIITESLSGNGTAASTHSVNLSWDANTSSSVSGYNIYRAVSTSSCGSFSRINSVLNTGTLYTDFTVADGTSYCYAATTVDSSQQESAYSNVVTNIQIPAP